MATILPLRWRKSSWSAQEADCVEIAWPAEAVAVRDSKNPGTVLALPRSAVSALMRSIR
jgi:hypothetical protein